MSIFIYFNKNFYIYVEMQQKFTHRAVDHYNFKIMSKENSFINIQEKCEK